MRQILIFALALVALAHVVAGQTAIASTAVRSFSYNGFTASSEADFGVGLNPVFGPQNLTLTFYDPLGGTDRIEIGAVWYRRRVQLDSFNVTFTVGMSNLSHTGIGNPDGFALVVQNYRPNTFGAGAGGLGYGSTPDFDHYGISNSVAIEFDTYMDENLNDPNSNHISLHYSSSPDNPFNSADEAYALNPPGAVSDGVPPIAGATHTYNVQYNNQQISVYIDGSANPVYQATINISNVLHLNSSGAYIGLTAACIGTCETVSVTNWAFNYVSILDGTKTFVTNLKNTTSAGHLSSFNIQGVDTNGYYYQTGGYASNFAVSFTPVGITSPVTAPVASVNDVGDGTYFITYTPYTAGQYSVSVTYNGVPIAGTPFILTVSPSAIDPTKSDVYGNTNGGVAGQTLNITITGKDSWGNVNLYNSPPTTFTAWFNGSNPVTSTFVGNGTYLIQYSLTAAKPYILTITYNGTQQQVKGSPFSPLTITPALPDAPSSYAAAAGIVGGTAGVTLPVTVVVRDRYLNNITTGMPANYQLVGVWDKSVAGNNVSFAPQSDGTYSGSYSITTAGTYHLSVLLNGQAIAGSPFTVTIVPQTTTSAAQSVAFGPGLTTASAGVNASFTVQARDAYGNNMTASTSVIAVHFTDSTGASQNIASTASYTGAGLFTVSYVPTLAVATLVTITLDNTPIKGSPYTVSVQPGVLDPNQCFAQGLGLVTPQTKVPLSFVVITADHYNNRLKVGGANVAVTLTESKSGATVIGSVTDLNNGAYNVGFTLTRSGTYNITITANGSPIDHNSPYSLVVPNQGLGTLGWALIVLGVIALVAVVGGGAFWYLKYYKARSDYDEIGA